MISIFGHLMQQLAVMKRDRYDPFQFLYFEEDNQLNNVF